MLDGPLDLVPRSLVIMVRPGGDTLSDGLVDAPARRRGLAIWALIWAGLLTFAFVGVTVVTLTLWLSDPDYPHTTPLVDLAFFALGALIAVGVAVQVRRPERNVAGAQQALIGTVALAAAGVAGARVEPAVGGMVLAAVVLVLVTLHPERRAVVRPGPGASPVLLVLAGVAAVPAVWYAVDLLALARAAEESCFGGQCVHGDRLAETAALAVAVVALVGAAAGRPAGARVSIWSAGIGAVVVSLAAIALPDVEGAPLSAWAAVALIWGVLVVLLGERDVRRVSAAPR